ncbi:hypothetical protein JCM14469_09390 [Desulfatiferula olefinivorans]
MPSIVIKLTHLMPVLLMGVLLSQNVASAGDPLPRMAKNALFLAQQSLDAGQTDKALSALDGYLNDQSAHPPEIFLMKGYVLMVQDHPEQALSTYTQGLTRHPGHVDLTVSAAVAAYRAGRFDEAGRWFSLAHGLKRQSGMQPEPGLLFQAASAYWQAENLPLAEKTLTMLITESPSPRVEWLTLLAHVQIRSKKLDDAKKTVTRLLEHQPDKGDNWRLMAQIHMDLNQFEQAAAALDIAGHIGPQDTRDWENLADLYRYIHAPLKAADCLKKAYSGTVTPERLTILADLYARALRYDEAVSLIQTAIDQAPGIDLFLKKGQYLYQARRVEEASRAFEQVLRRDPEHGKANLMAGFCAMDLKHWKQAKRSFARAARSRDVKTWAQGSLAVVDELIASQAGS